MLAPGFGALSLRRERLLLLHTLAVPAALALAAIAAHSTGLDERVSAAFFDPATRAFPAHQWALLEALGHRLPRTMLIGFWLALVGVSCASPLFPRLREHVGLAWLTVLAMALGPTVVAVLKELNAYRCPWDLARFGGVADYSSGWFVSNLNAGHCFPSGHAAAGFSLVALFFCGLLSGNRSLHRGGMAAALVLGAGFSLVRIAQGAHFLSHTLWSAAIDWICAALVFAPWLIASGADSVPAREPH